MKHAKVTEPNFIFETKHWEAYLNPDQYYLGRSVVVAKENVGSMSELSDEQWLDFAKIVKSIEAATKKAFGATMFNWTCLMNNAYRNDPPDPQVHWHFRPRYKNSVSFEGINFEDKEFGEHYARGSDFFLPDDIFFRVIETMRLNISND